MRHITTRHHMTCVTYRSNETHRASQVTEEMQHQYAPVTSFFDLRCMYRRELNLERREAQLKDHEDDLTLREQRWKRFQQLMNVELQDTIHCRRRSSQITMEHETRPEQSTVAPAGSDVRDVDCAEEDNLHHDTQHQSVDQAPPPEGSIAAAVIRKRRTRMASLTEDAAVVVEEVPEVQESDRAVHSVKKSVRSIVSSTRTAQKKQVRGASHKRTQEGSDSGTPKKVT